MGNNQSCVDCNTDVPRKVKWLDYIGGDWGRRFCRWANNEIWIKISENKYICSPCLIKRQNQERQRQQVEERRRQEERSRQEERRRQEERSRQEERRKKEERRRQEWIREMRRREEMRLERRQEERRQEERRREEKRQEERRQEERRREEKRQEERRQEERRRDEEKRQEERRQEERRREEKRQEERRQEERRRDEKKRQEERRQEEQRKQDEIKRRKENWKREKGATNIITKSQTIKIHPMLHHYNSKMSFSFSEYSNPMKKLPVSIADQKKERCILQEMISKGNFNKAEVTRIGNVLVIIEKKIMKHRNQYVYLPSNKYIFRKFFGKSNVTCTNSYWYCKDRLTGNLEELTECIFEICLAVQMTKKYWPRNTQIASLYLLIEAIKKGILLEVNTGEGKTCIIAMFSAFLALSKFTVDIVSSSPILAQRDYIEWEEFYKLLHVSVSCNLIPHKTEDRLECYSKSVVYGTVGSFASDILRQTFQMQNVRGERKCEAVIVDEVDCMLLDQGVHFTYLSHAVPGMYHIEPILFMIWKHILKHPRIVSDKSEHFFLGILDSLQVVLSSFIDLNQLCETKVVPSEIMWLYFLEEKNVLETGFTNAMLQGNMEKYKSFFTTDKLLKCLNFVQTVFPIIFQSYRISGGILKAEPLTLYSNSEDVQIVHVLLVGEGLLCILYPYKDEIEIHKFVKDEIKHYISFDGCKPNKHYIPSYLEQFVENRLISWIENAFTANTMIKGREYLVKDNGVVPVDFDSTGVVQLDTKWGDCLHQFLEIKHEKKMSHISLVTNFMSNQKFFNCYNGKIFGVSGTLGTEREKSFLMRQFGLDCKEIPTYRPKVFKEEPGSIYKTEDEWSSAIKDIVRDKVTKTSNKQQRAVLVICEDINTADKLKKKLTENVTASVALYTRNDENNDEIDRTLKPGHIIVATNIAGRGTDIDIDESVEKAGGLFVLVTFLPQNTRIENQVFGRSARKGQPGSAQIVLNRSDLPLYFSRHEFKDIKSLKNLRDAIEEQRIVDIEKQDFEEIRVKENLFAYYCSFLHKIKKQLNFKGVDEKIMLDSLHEYWGMWLKMNCETRAKRPPPDDLRSLLAVDLKKASENLFKKISPCSNISYMIKFANEQLLIKRYTLAKELLTSAINLDRKWAAIAYYNRAYISLLKRDKGYMKDAIDDLIKSQECLPSFKEEFVLCLTLSRSVVDERNSEHEATEIASQFNFRCQFIDYFEDNIKDTIQQLSQLQTENKEATAEGSNIFTILLGDNNIGKKIESEIYIFWEMGLTELILLKERKPFCWKGMLVMALGVLQIAGGAVVIASTTGLLLQLGWGLIAEGVNDICTGAFAVWNRNQEFMKSWLIKKAVSIATSIASFGYNHVKDAVKGVKGIKETFSAVKDQLRAGAKTLLSELKTMGQTVTCKSFEQAFQTTCLQVGKDVGTELAKRGGKYLLEVAQEKMKTFFEDIAKERIKKETNLAFTEGEMHPMINHFISFHCKNNKQKDQICPEYMEITKNLLRVENIRQFRQVLLGCVKDVIKSSSEKMKAETNDIFKECEPILDIINGLSCASSNMKQLLSIYCEHVNTAFNKIYKDLLTNEANGYDKIGDQDLCMIKQQIIDQTAQFLFELLMDSFQFTGSGILAEKLQTAVGQFVNEYGTENKMGNELIRKISIISSKEDIQTNDETEN
ncbi:unnamed protein product [Mytilus coruscus]|uniref:Uncharacterized protein n=1 Tax=Mytilus coruscus TaxID=42192 RepID=A0A6J8E419_MYTCO|nr:unnamed protein product [Mytilus coruscus]